MDTQLNLDLPEFAISFFSNLPIEQFNRSLKLNRDWYKECRRELENRRKTGAKKYQDSKEEREKAKKAERKYYYSDRFRPASDPYLMQCNKIRKEMLDINHKDYFMLIDIDRACIRCGFFDLIDCKQLEFYKRQYHYGSMRFYNFALPKDEAIVIVVIDAVKAICKSALGQGFNITSCLVKKYIKYIKNIQSAIDPDQRIKYILSTAEKLFPDLNNKTKIANKFRYIETKYDGTLQERICDLYRIYQNIIKETYWFYIWLPPV